MTENQDNQPSADDPRFAFAAVTDRVGNLMESVSDSELANATPCPEFTVKELMEHIVLVMRRAAAIGAGSHWSSVEQEAQDSGWAESYRSAAHDVMQAWTDPAKLGQMFDVPWGTLPGAPILMTYTAELATHGWDLGQATSRPFTVDDDLLGNALTAVQFIPAEGRGTEEVPFSEVVVPLPGASVLDQIAGWTGRNVLG